MVGVPNHRAVKMEIPTSSRSRSRKCPKLPEVSYKKVQLTVTHETYSHWMRSSSKKKGMKEEIAFGNEWNCGRRETGLPKWVRFRVGVFRMRWLWIKRSFLVTKRVMCWAGHCVLRIPWVVRLRYSTSLDSSAVDVTTQHGGHVTVHKSEFRLSWRKKKCCLYINSLCQSNCYSPTRTSSPDGSKQWHIAPLSPFLFLIHSLVHQFRFSKLLFLLFLSLSLWLFLFLSSSLLLLSSTRILQDSRLYPDFLFSSSSPLCVQCVFHNWIFSKYMFSISRMIALVKRTRKSIQVDASCKTKTCVRD